MANSIEGSESNMEEKSVQNALQSCAGIQRNKISLALMAYATQQTYSYTCEILQNSASVWLYNLTM